MGAIYQNDRDRWIEFVLAPVTEPDSITEVRMMVRKPDGTTVEWYPAILGATATEVTVAVVLASDGSDVDQSGTYHVRAWMYIFPPTVIETTMVGSFVVYPEVCAWPPALAAMQVPA